MIIVTAAQELGECLWLLLSTNLSFAFLHVLHIDLVSHIWVEEGRVLLNVSVDNLLSLAVR